MPLIVLAATAEGSDTGFTLGAGGSKTAAVALPDDDDTTYIQNTSGVAQRQSFAMDNLPPATSVGSHTVKTRNRSTTGGGDAMAGYVYLAGVRTDGTSPALTGSYVTKSEVDLARPGGGSWAPADINAAEVGVWHTSAASGNGRTTSVTWEVNYIPVPGGWMSITAALLGPVLGAGLLLRDMARLIALFNRVAAGRHIIYGHEAEAMYRDLRAYRYPHYVGA